MPETYAETRRSAKRPLGRIARSESVSFRLNVRRLDDRPPLLDLGLVEGAERFRRLLLGRENLLTKLGEPRPYRRIGQGLHHRGIELGDDVPGRVLGHP